MAGFNDKIVIVTGASEGIGRALCLKLLEHRAKIVISARNKERLNELKHAIESLGASILAVPADVTDKIAAKAIKEAK